MRIIRRNNPHVTSIVPDWLGEREIAEQRAVELDENFNPELPEETEQIPTQQVGSRFTPDSEAELLAVEADLRKFWGDVQKVDQPAEQTSEKTSE